MLGMTISPLGEISGGEDVSTYHAQMIGEQDIQPATAVTFSDWMRQSVNPLLYGVKSEFKIVKVSLLIKDSTRSACMLDISRLCADLQRCTTKFLNEPYFYDCQMIATPALTRKSGDTRWQLDVTLQSGFAYLPAVSTALTGQSQSITAQGNLPSPAVVTITPAQDIGSLTLTGLTKKPITISNLHANAPVTIDGESCTVTEPDLDTIMTTGTGAGKWMVRIYNMPNMFSPDTINADHVPTKSDIPSDYAYRQNLISGESTWRTPASNQLLHFKTGLYVSSAKSITLDFYHDDGVNVLLNDASVFSCAHAEDGGGNPGKGTAVLNLNAGWNKLEFLLLNHYGIGGIWGFKSPVESMVDQLNAYYARDADPSGTVNKFSDCDMWSWPAISPGEQTVAINSAVAAASVAYKPKFM